MFKFIATIAVIAIIVYLCITYIYGKATIKDAAPEKFDISGAKWAYSTDNTQRDLLTPGSSTIMTFVNVKLGDKTASTTSDYQSLIGVEGSFSLDISPKSTQLSVTTKHQQQITTETVQIPQLPLQKWVCITILRDGRRFDIMYDDQIVASHRFEYYPIVAPSPLIVGNKTLLGTGIHVLVASYRLTPSEVSKQRSKLCDTTGKPVGADTAFGLPPIPFTGIRSICFPGIPCNPVSAPPGNALKSWSTPFS